jgi:hypothetical protein
VRVARALESLPLITSEFGAGKLSYSKVRALTRVATEANEADLVGLAQHATAAQVERVVRAYRSVLDGDDDTAAANRRHAVRYLSYGWADDGSLEGRFRMPPEMAAIFMAGVTRARAHLPEEPTAENGPAGPLSSTNVDALILMADAFLSGGSESPSRGDRSQIVINADAEVLADDGDGECSLDDGPVLAPETVRRLACDASLVYAERDPAGNTVGTSRKAPAIPAATRRAVRARDKGCRFAGCGGRVFTHIHHVRHRSRKGGNELTNLVELCWFHHRLVHEGGWDLRFDADGEVVVIRPNGNVLPRQSMQSYEPGRIEHDNRRLAIRIDATTCVPRWYGDRLELHEIISSLVSTEVSAPAFEPLAGAGA